MVPGVSSTQWSNQLWVAHSSVWPLDQQGHWTAVRLSHAENTKLQSTKVQKALQVLYTNKVLTVSVPKNSKLEDVLDKMDTAVRIPLAMLRTLKTSETLKAKVFRMLSREEQVRIELCLDKIKLPANFWSPTSEEELGKPKSVCTAIVLMKLKQRACQGQAGCHWH